MSGKNSLSRRSFITMSGVGAAALAGVGLVGCAGGTDASASKADYLPEAWDAECDIVIIGHGGAEAAAAITCTNEGLGEIYVMEAAPEGQDGGNTKVSMNLMFIPDEAEGAFAYQTTLNGKHVVEEELVRAWAENIVATKKWFDDLGIELKESSAFSPEFPEVEGSDISKTYLVGGVAGSNSLWNALVDQEEYLGTQVHYDTRALKLFRNPETNEALGVQAEQDGKTINVKARKGIILSCGGFEANQEMTRSYLGAGQSVYPTGTPFNRGDGFAMIEPFGAKLWHMNSVAGTSFGVAAAGLDSPVASGTLMGYAMSPIHNYVFVGADGKRFIYEETVGNNRHGKVVYSGTYVDLRAPDGMWGIFDQTFFDSAPIASKAENLIGWLSNVEEEFVATDNQGFLDAGVIVKAETIEELAEVTNLGVSALKKTLEEYNANAANGSDPLFGRGEEVISNIASMDPDTHFEDGGEGVAVPAFDLVPINPPFYATPIRGTILNTQGGPKRNGNCQILDRDNQPIGRLYGTGEFGSIYSYMYNGGGNVADAVTSGRIAARHAASLAPWDAE